jgi:isocitrate dehydrogenase
METTRITVAKGDGIGPEIMDATLAIITAAGARIETDEIVVGEQVYLAGNTAGIPDEAWDVIRRNKNFLKAPFTTPQGGGYKSLNVTIRKTLGLYVNLRPNRSYHPIIPCKAGAMDLVIVRENEEDLYAGIEYQQTPEVILALKMITRPGSEKIVRFAFEYARATGRKRVTCMTKDNILKMTDGLFHKIFDEVGKEYADIEQDHWIIDIGMARLADTPQAFDVVVMPNLYGDVASDVVAQVAGSVGVAGSANIGLDYAMFEAIHGSAPRHAGQNRANPSGLLNGAIMMLVHIGQPEVAERVENAWLKTLEDKIFTYDLARTAREGGDTSYTEVGTREFAQAVIDRLGQRPSTLKPASYAGSSVTIAKPTIKDVRGAAMSLRGVDVFIHEPSRSPEEFGPALAAASGPDLKLVIVSNRGQLVYPAELVEMTLSDQYSCRFEADREITRAEVRELLARLEGAGFNWAKTEGLFYMDGERAYTLSQGQ